MTGSKSRFVPIAADDAICGSLIPFEHAEQGVGRSGVFSYGLISPGRTAATQAAGANALNLAQEEVLRVQAKVDRE